MAFEIKNGILTKYTEEPGVTEIAIPAGVTGIGAGAFEGCKNLTNITIPEGVTEIGTFSFRGCESLTSIAIPESVTSIYFGAFKGCNALQDANAMVILNGILFDYLGEGGDITIPEGVTGIDSGAFDGRSRLTSIVIPDSVTEIGMMAFCECSSLKEIKISKNISRIENGTFLRCKNLADITIPEAVKHIGEKAFCDCESLKKIILPKAVTTIGNSAFGGCAELICLTIEGNVGSIKRELFRSDSGNVGFTKFNKDMEIKAFQVPLSNVEGDLKKNAVSGFLSSYNAGEKLPEQCLNDYCKYIKAQRKKYYPKINDMPGLLRFMIDRKIIKPDEVEPLIEAASLKGQNEPTAKQVTLWGNCMVYVHGILHASIVKLVAVGNEDEVRRLLTSILENAATYGKRFDKIPDNIEEQYAAIVALANEPVPSVNFAYLMPNDKKGSRPTEFCGEFRMVHHSCGLYGIVFSFYHTDSPLSEKTLKPFLSLHKQSGNVYMRAISTGTSNAGYGGIDHSIMDGEIISDYEEYREMAYYLHCKMYKAGAPEDFQTLLKNLDKQDKPEETIQQLKDSFSYVCFGNDDADYQEWQQDEELMSRIMHMPISAAEDEYCPEWHIREAVASHLLYDGGNGLCNELDILGAVCYGLYDENTRISNPATADMFFRASEDKRIQAAIAIFRLIYDKGLSDELRGEYNKLIRRRASQAVKIAGENDRAFVIKMLIDLGVINQKNLYAEYLNSLPMACQAVIDAYRGDTERKQKLAREEMQKSADGDDLKSVEVYRAWAADVRMQIANDFDGRKLITLKTDGTVVADYAELAAWKQVLSVFCVCGVLGGITENGRILCHRTIEHPNAHAIETALAGWTDIASVAVYGDSAPWQEKLLEDMYCVGIKKDGSVITCGKKLRGDASASWRDAKQAFTDGKCFGIVTKAGLVRAFGRLTPLDGYTNVDHASKYEQRLILKDGRAVIFEDRNHIYGNFERYAAYDTHQWVALPAAGFETNHKLYGYEAVTDELTIRFEGSQNVRLRKFGIPSDFVCIYNEGTSTAAMAVLYPNGNVRIFADNIKPGTIVVKKAVSVTVENGAIIAKGPNAKAVDA